MMMVHPGWIVAAVLSAPGTDEESVEVKAGPFQASLELEGHFDQPDRVEVAAEPEVYKGALEILEATMPGPVEAGQVLVRFDAEEYEAALTKARLDHEAAEIGFHKQFEDAELAREAAAIRRAAARMSLEKAELSFANYRDVLMPMRLEEAAMSLQSSRDRLADQEAQFVQLEKMYKSDDLIEETEEIVVNRARRALNQQRERMKLTEKRHVLQVEQDIPKELESQEFTLRKARSDFALAEKTHALDRRNDEIERQKAEAALARQHRDLERLEADRQCLKLTAPRSGLAVRGTLAKGRWVGLASALEGVEKGAKATAGKVLYTIVAPGPDVVWTQVSEASVLDLRPGQKASLHPAALPGVELAAEVTWVAPVSADGKFDVRLKVEDSDQRLYPGHRSKVEIVLESHDDALTVPEAAVSEVDGRDLVEVLTQDGVEPREVELGRRSDGRVHVLRGLRAGERVRSQFGKAK